MIRLDQVENYTGIVVMNPLLIEEIQADEEALAAETITAHKMIVLPVSAVEKIWEPRLHPRDLNGKFIKTLGRKKKFEFFEVGGAVRDEVLGVPTKDVDFSVVASDNTGTAEERFSEMVEHLTNQGFEIFVSNPEFLTVRAKVPKKHKLASRTDVADFVLARADGPSTDGRRPDWVVPGTLLDDLSRRDFTVNAMARASDGSLVDPFGGQADLQSMTLRFVGEPMDRIREDGLRTVRAFRFAVTKGMTIESRTWDAITSKEAADKLASVSKERMRDELEKMLKEDTLGTMALLAKLPDWTVKAMFPNGLRLSATLKKSGVVNKRFDPSQIRGRDGRWIKIGSTAKRPWDKGSGAFWEVPDSWYAGSNDAPRIPTEKDLLPLSPDDFPNLHRLESTPMKETLQEARTDWKGDPSSFRRVATDILEGRGIPPWASGMYTRDRWKTAAVLNQVAKAPFIDDVLYRGVASRTGRPLAGLIKNIQVGDSFDWLPSGFSASRDIATEFANSETGGASVVKALFILESGSRAWSIDGIPFLDSGESEHLVAGGFRVVDIQEAKGKLNTVVKVITIRQFDPLELPDDGTRLWR